MEVRRALHQNSVCRAPLLNTQHSKRCEVAAHATRQLWQGDRLPVQPLQEHLLLAPVLLGVPHSKCIMVE